MMLGVKQMLKARGNKLLGGEIDHDALIIESLCSYFICTHLGVLDCAEVDERLSLDTVDQDLVDIIVTITFEVVE